MFQMSEQRKNSSFIVKHVVCRRKFMNDTNLCFYLYKIERHKKSQSLNIRLSLIKFERGASND